MITNHTNLLAPVCIFNYKRLDSLKQCIANLKLCLLSDDTELFIFNDGADHGKDVQYMETVRVFLQSIEGFKKINLDFAEAHFCLAESVIKGVTSVIRQYGKVIVLEDDLLVSPNFLTFMNQSLDFYSKNPRVFSISGYCLPLKIPDNYTHDVYVLPRAGSWGWASWKDRWENIDWEVSDYQQFRSNRELVKLFNKGGSDMAGMLEKQMQGKIDSWAIRWCYHQFKMKSYTVYPVISKVNNIGFDTDATNTHVYNRFKTPLDTKDTYNFNLPKTVFINKKLLRQFQHFHSLKSRIIARVLTGFHKILRRA